MIDVIHSARYSEQAILLYCAFIQAHIMIVWT